MTSTLLVECVIPDCLAITGPKGERTLIFSHEILLLRTIVSIVLSFFSHDEAVSDYREIDELESRFVLSRIARTIM